MKPGEESPRPSKGLRTAPGLSRRQFAKATSALAAVAMADPWPWTSPRADAAVPAAAVKPSPDPVAFPHRLLTPAAQFRDVSRGNPRPHSLKGDALVQARLTPQTWRMEVVADRAVDAVVKVTPDPGRELTLGGGTALDLPALLELGKKHEVRLLKAMQCLNIPAPLGQGLWEGVPLREVLRLCGPLRNVRRVYYWGFHNQDPKQVFRSSLSFTQAMETAPGEMPPFLAYRLNGEPISLIRGGPVRMIIPWAHGFKSIKWLQRITLTNDHRANDTYAEQNNDPESHLKTAAYLDDLPAKIPEGNPVHLLGQVISGLSGVKRVEYSLAREADDVRELRWSECQLEEPPADWTAVLPAGVSPRQVLGFNPQTGGPLSWPLRYSMISWMATLKGLARGKYTARARAVDLNGFAQPEPRPHPTSGRNAPDAREFEVV